MGDMIEKVVSLVRLLGDVDGIIPIKTHLKGDFGFSGILYLAFLFIEEILHEVPKGSGSILSYTSSQTLSVSPAINDLADLCLISDETILKQFSFLLDFSLTYP